MADPVLIPTYWKSKIPQTHSYPVNAKLISEGLIGSPQYSNLHLRFWNSDGLSTRSAGDRAFGVIKIEYSGPMKYFSVSKETAEHRYRRRWIITVEPVPREFRTRIRTLVDGEALPTMQAWLQANDHTNDREGGHCLWFTYDPLLDQLKSHEYASLEWKTPRG